jgi:hypothetical protein
VGVAVGIGGIDRPALVNRLGWVGQIKGNEATIPIGKKDELAIIRRLGSMSILYW